MAFGVSLEKTPFRFEKLLCQRPNPLTAHPTIVQTPSANNVSLIRENTAGMQGRVLFSFEFDEKAPRQRYWIKVYDPLGRLSVEEGEIKEVEENTS